MSDLWLPPSVNRTPVQISEKQRVCVLTHMDTGRILCFCMDDAFASSFEQKGYLKHEILHAHEYDLWAKRLREQSKAENEAEDHAYLERENFVRHSLRKELRDKLRHAHSGAARQAIESALHCMDLMEDRKKRYRSESFMVQEGFEAKTDAGTDLVNEIMTPKQK